MRVINQIDIYLTNYKTGNNKANHIYFVKTNANVYQLFGTNYLLSFFFYI